MFESLTLRNECGKNNTAEIICEDVGQGESTGIQK